MERKLLLLGILRQQEMHGYGLFEFIERDLAVCVGLKKPTAYFLLNQMAMDGWISVAEIREGNRPPRHVYSLTTAGENQFQQLLRQALAGPGMPNFPGEIGLAFLDILPAIEALDLLRDRRERLALALAEASFAPKHQGSLQFVLDHRIHFMASELAWLDGLIEQWQVLSSPAHLPTGEIE